MADQAEWEALYGQIAPTPVAGKSVPNEDKWMQDQAETLKFWKELPADQLREHARRGAEENRISPPINRHDEYMKYWEEERAKVLEDEKKFLMSPKQLREQGVK